jgi:hypothetical protein
MPNSKNMTCLRVPPSIALALLCLLLAVGGCGRSQTDEAGTTTASAGSQAPAQSVEQLGESIREIYLRAMRETTTMLQDKPSPDQVAAELADSKQQWIAEMVALGRQIEKLDEAEQQRAHAAVRSMYRDLQKDPGLSADWQAFNRSINAYIASDPEFFRELKPLNILTQYAFFDLLRQQTPKEAERLGLTTTAAAPASTSQVSNPKGDPE